MADCADSRIPGERPHPAEPGKGRCEFHEKQRRKWTDLNTKRNERGSHKGAKLWRDHVTPRPARHRGAEISAREAANIRANVAAVAFARAPIDTAVGNDYRVEADEIRPLLTAVNDLIQSLGDVGLDDPA